MGRITVFTAEDDAESDWIVQSLAGRGVPFVEVVLSSNNYQPGQDSQWDQLVELSGHVTAPQIFVNEEYFSAQDFDFVFLQLWDDTVDRRAGTVTHYNQYWAEVGRHPSPTHPLLQPPAQSPPAPASTSRERERHVEGCQMHDSHSGNNNCSNHSTSQPRDVPSYDNRMHPSEPFMGYQPISSSSVTTGRQQDNPYNDIHRQDYDGRTRQEHRPPYQARDHHHRSRQHSPVRGEPPVISRPNMEHYQSTSSASHHLRRPESTPPPPPQTRHDADLYLNTSDSDLNYHSHAPNYYHPNNSDSEFNYHHRRHEDQQHQRRLGSFPNPSHQERFDTNRHPSFPERNNSDGDLNCQHPRQATSFPNRERPILIRQGSLTDHNSDNDLNDYLHQLQQQEPGLLHNSDNNIIYNHHHSNNNKDGNRSHNYKPAPPPQDNQMSSRRNDDRMSSAMVSTPHHPTHGHSRLSGSIHKNESTHNNSSSLLLNAGTDHSSFASDHNNSSTRLGGFRRRQNSMDKDAPIISSPRHPTMGAGESLSSRSLGVLPSACNDGAGDGQDVRPARSLLERQLSLGRLNTNSSVASDGAGSRRRQSFSHPRLFAGIVDDDSVGHGSGDHGPSISVNKNSKHGNGGGDDDSHGRQGPRSPFGSAAASLCSRSTTVDEESICSFGWESAPELLDSVVSTGTTTSTSDDNARDPWPAKKASQSGGRCGRSPARRPGNLAASFAAQKSTGRNLMMQRTSSLRNVHTRSEAKTLASSQYEETPTRTHLLHRGNSITSVGSNSSLPATVPSVAGTCAKEVTADETTAFSSTERRNELLEAIHKNTPSRTKSPAPRGRRSTGIRSTSPCHDNPGTKRKNSGAKVKKTSSNSSTGSLGSQPSLESARSQGSAAFDRRKHPEYQPEVADDTKPILNPHGTWLSVRDATEELKELLPSDNLHYNLTTYYKCFVGSVGCSALAEYYNISRSEAEAYGQRLNEAGILHHVVYDHKFEDSKQFFRLQCFQTPHILNSYRIWTRENSLERYSNGMTHSGSANRLIGIDQINKSSDTLSTPNPAMELVLDLLWYWKKIEKFIRDPKTGKLRYTRACEHQLYTQFEEAVCELDCVNLDKLSLNKNEMMAFGLNLYRLMLQYAFTKIGVSTSEVSRRTLLKKVKFVVGGHVFSFDDWFHGVLRGNRHHMCLETQRSTSGSGKWGKKSGLDSSSQSRDGGIAGGLDAGSSHSISSSGSVKVSGQWGKASSIDGGSSLNIGSVGGVRSRDGGGNRYFRNQDPRGALFIKDTVVDHRIHFAINYAFGGVPMPVKSFTAEHLDAELAAVANAFCKDDSRLAVDASKGTLRLCKAFSSSDFCEAFHQLPFVVIRYLQGKKKDNLNHMIANQGKLGNIKVSFYEAKSSEWSSHAEDFVPLRDSKSFPRAEVKALFGMEMKSKKPASSASSSIGTSAIRV